MKALILRPEEIEYNVANPIYEEVKITKSSLIRQPKTRIIYDRKHLVLHRAMLLDKHRVPFYVYAPTGIVESLNHQDRDSKEEKKQLAWFQLTYNVCTSDKNKLLNSWWQRFLFLLFPRLFFKLA